MAYRFFVRREGHVLVPTAKAGHLAIENMKFGAHYLIQPKQPRNGKQHRLFWAFTGYLAKALNDGPSGAIWDGENVKDTLLVATGRCRTRPMTKPERERNDIRDDRLLSALGAIRAALAPIQDTHGPMVTRAVAGVLQALDALAARPPQAFVAQPVSISFVAMDNDQFSAFMDDAMIYVRDHLAPWIEASDHWPEIEKILVASYLLRNNQEDDPE